MKGASTGKPNGRRNRVEKEDKKTEIVQTVEQSPETPVISDWSRDKKVEDEEFEIDDEHDEHSHNYRRPRALAFDRTEVAKFADKKLSELSMDELLQYVVTLGEKQKNPTISRGVGRVLKEINGERSYRKPFSENGFRGGGFREYGQRREFDKPEEVGETSNQPSSQNTDGFRPTRSYNPRFNGRDGERDNRFNGRDNRFNNRDSGGNEEGYNRFKSNRGGYHQNREQRQNSGEK
jgi:hypothetical protein